MSNSTTIDNRVVEMQFNNAQFEENVKESMGTLDRLKQSLNFKSASQGFDELNKASKDVSMDGLIKGVETAKSHFSAMEVIGITALANITTAAMRAGTRIAKSLTIDQVTSGFNEYELKMGSIQTIMAGTGESLETVTSYLNELNEYSDKTIYSFSDMTQNIGKFTNAGVKLEDAVTAIKGISNEAAVSGANAQEASRAMYNFSQALSAGYVKLIDWKSIENANMATKEFKQNLIDTAVELGTLKKTSDGMYSVGKKTLNATKDFNDSLQEGWMTTDVLVQTLRDYADETTEIGKKSTEAATKVRKFTQLMDTLKEAVGSGWAQSFEIIIGDFFEATDLFTGLSDHFGNIISNIANARNELLSGAFSSNYKQITSQFEEAGISTEKFTERLQELALQNGLVTQEMIDDAGSFEATFKSGWLNSDIIKSVIKSFTGGLNGVSESVELTADNLKQFDKIVTKVINGDFGNGTERMKKLADAGYDYATIQALVNSRLSGTKLNMDNMASTINNMSEKQLESAGYTKEQAKALKELAKQAEKTGTPLNELIENINRPSGRELMIDSIKNAWSGLIMVLKSVKDAWNQTFDSLQASDIYSVLVHINKFTKGLAGNKKKADKLTRSFKGMFAVLKLIRTIVKTGLNVVLKVLSAVLGGVDDDLLSVTAALGDFTVSIANALTPGKGFLKVVNNIADGLANGIRAIKDWVRGHIDLGEVTEETKLILHELWEIIKLLADKFNVIDGAEKLVAKTTERLNKVFEFFTSGSSNASLSLDGFVESIKGLNKNDSILSKTSTLFENFTTGVSESLKNFGGKVEGTTASITTFSEDSGESTETLGTKFVVLRDTVTGCMGKIKDAITDDYFSQLLAVGLGAGIMVMVKKIADLLGATRTAIFDFSGGLTSILGGVGRSLKQFSNLLKAKALVELAKAIAILVGSLVALTLLAKYDWDSMKKATGVLTGMIAVMAALLYASSKLEGGNGLSSVGAAGIIIGFAVAIGVLTHALKELQYIDVESLKIPIITLTGMIAVLIAAVAGLSKLTGGMAFCALEIIAIAIAVRIFVGAIKKLASIDLSGMTFDNWAVLTGCFVGLTAVMMASKFAGQYAAQGAGAMIAIAVGLKTLISALEDLMELDLSKLDAGRITLLVGVVAGFGVLMRVAGKSGAHAIKAGISLLAMTFAMNLMIGLVKRVSKLDKSGLDKSIIAAGSMMTFLALLIAIANRAGTGTGMAGLFLIGLSTAIIGLSLAMVMLGKLKPGDVTKGVIAVGGIAAAMYALMQVSSKAKGSWRTIMALSAAIGVISVAVIALSFIKTDKLIGAVAAITMLMGSFTVLAKFGAGANASIKTMVTLTVMVGLLGGLIALISNLDPQTAMTNTFSISVLLLSLSAACKLLNGTVFNPTALVSLGVVSAMAALLGVVLTKLSTMGNMDNAIKMAKSLSTLLLALSASVAILSVAGLVGVPAAITGIGSLIVLIVAIGTLATALGGLTSKFPKIEEFLTAGLPILQKIGQGLGEFVGGIIGGIGSGMAACLPNIADSLSEFADKLDPFLTKMSNVDDGLFKSVSNVCKAILVLTGTEFIKSIGEIFFGEQDLTKFGDDLSGFAEAIVKFGNTISNSNVDLKKVKTAAEAGKLLAEMAANIPNEGGLLGLLAGENDIKKFATDIGSFAMGIVSFSSIVSASNIDTKKVSSAAEAGKLLAEMAESIPNAGGALAALVGDNDLEAFSTDIGYFAKGVVSFCNTISGSKINISSVEAAANAGKTIAEMASNLPNSGGLVSLFTGDNDLSTFSKNLEGFGQGIANLSSKVSGKVDVGAIEAVCTAAATLAKGVGKNDNKYLNGFGGQLKNFGENLGKFYDTVAYIDARKLKDLSGAVSQIAKAFTDKSDDAVLSMSELLKHVSDSIKSNNSKKEFKSAGAVLMDSLIEGIKSKEQDVMKATSKVTSNVAKNIKNDRNTFINSGKYLMDGLANGIKNNTSSVTNAIKNTADMGTNTLNQAWLIHSPSKVGEDSGMFFDLGIAKGIVGFAGKVKNATSNMADGTIDMMRSAIGRVSSIIQNGVDTDPVIRPVIDLSAVESGAGAISGMFNDNYAIRANVGSISSMMNNRQQVMSTNDDVVSAIHKLSNDLSGLHGDTYNVNGITYDDGSNVKSAIQTLVRESIVGRRM